MSKNKKVIYILLIIICISVGYCSGRYSMSNNSQNDTAIKALKNIKWNDLDAANARAILTNVLDASKVPHGDIAVPSNIVHSRRYVISQWQRSAVGAIVIVLGYDDEKDLSIAVGTQRGLFRTPQGYMELPLPKEDLTGLKKQGASRLNSDTMTAVSADSSIQKNAIREVYEEIGLNIQEEDLTLLDIVSDVNANPVCIAAVYMVKLPNTPILETYDHEFINDDLADPMWIKIKDIKYNATQDKYYIDASNIAIDNKTIDYLNKALHKLKSNPVAS